MINDPSGLHWGPRRKLRWICSIRSGRQAMTKSAKIYLLINLPCQGLLQEHIVLDLHVFENDCCAEKQWISPGLSALFSADSSHPLWYSTLESEMKRCLYVFLLLWIFSSWTMVLVFWLVSILLWEPLCYKFFTFLHQRILQHMGDYYLILTILNGNMI